MFGSSSKGGGLFYFIYYKYMENHFANLEEEDIKKSIIILALDNLHKEVSAILEITEMDKENQELYTFIKEASYNLLQDMSKDLPKNDVIQWNSL